MRNTNARTSWVGGLSQNFYNFVKLHFLNKEKIYFFSVSSKEVIKIPTYQEPLMIFTELREPGTGFLTLGFTSFPNTVTGILREAFCFLAVRSRLIIAVEAIGNILLVDKFPEWKKKSLIVF